MVFLAKIVNDFQPLTIFAKSSDLDVGLGSACASGIFRIYFLAFKGERKKFFKNW